MKTVLLFFGTRPEAIKMAPVAAELARDRSLRVRVAVSAQHRDMLDQVLAVFRIKADVDLDVMRPDQSLFDVTARVLHRFEAALDRLKPDLVLVHGDTTTTMAGSLAAFYRRVPVGHVEAGLRTHDLSRPFPEEMNRRVADVLAALHFAPTTEAAANLRREGVDPDRIFITGNTVIDALLSTARGAELPDDPSLARVLDGVRRRGEPLVLVTAHRRENFGAPFASIFDAIRDFARRHPDVAWIYPVHPNPNVAGPAKRRLGGLSNVHLFRPMGYRDLVSAMKWSTVVVTDSGGIQEEAPSLGKPVLVLRDVTERPEAVRAGTVKLVGTSGPRLARELETLLTTPRAYDRMARAVNPYGDGRAAERIAQGVRWFFGRGARPRPFRAGGR